ncbi:hypothetical protein [uncultured Castellaniella sp.]|uniref:hypothetical protein n=1 Tax=uncultured Castellaniella sp. TaxID=647907 RepID=UPI00261E7067|nr:hypothetical protein [uncultured Castellaniella sp.]
MMRDNVDLPDVEIKGDQVVVRFRSLSPFNQAVKEHRVEFSFASLIDKGMIRLLQEYSKEDAIKQKDALVSALKNAAEKVGSLEL